MAKFKVHFRTGDEEEIEADEVTVVADGLHYQFIAGDIDSGYETVALIPAEVVKNVQKIEG